jgi:arylformamidase
MEEVSYFDISPEISEQTAVFPGDTAFSRKVELDFTRGDNLVLSSIHTSVHIGAHTDSPSHYHQKGVGMSARPLDYYLGRCDVVEVKVARGERIRLGHFDLSQIKSKRILFKTLSFPNPNRWNSDFNSLSSEVIEALAKKGVKLVGIDTPSIDPENDKVLESHQSVFRNDMAILEGIVLDQVPEGSYVLLALPLKLKDADASPVRAVLVKGDRAWN